MDDENKEDFIREEEQYYSISFAHYVIMYSMYIIDRLTTKGTHQKSIG